MTEPFLTKLWQGNWVNLVPQNPKLVMLLLSKWLDFNVGGGGTTENCSQWRWHNWGDTTLMVGQLIFVLGDTTEVVLSGTTEMVAEQRWQNSGGGTTDLTRWAAAFGEAASGEEERLRRGGANQQWNIFTWIPSSLHPAAWILSGSHLDSQQLKFSPESHLVPRSSNWIPPKFNLTARF